MRVGLHPLRMVDGIACSMHGGAVRHVSDRVGEQGSWQPGAICMRVGAGPHFLRMIDCIASFMHRCAVWQVSHIIEEVKVDVSILLSLIEGFFPRHFGLSGFAAGSPHAQSGCCDQGAGGNAHGSPCLGSALGLRSSHLGHLVCAERHKRLLRQKDATKGHCSNSCVVPRHLGSERAACETETETCEASPEP